jgi:DNA-binding MarR family transcriptional regulator
VKPASRKGKNLADIETSKAKQGGQGVEIIASVLSPAGEPILGLYLYAAADMVLRSIKENPEYRTIKAHLLGTPSVLSVRPGISQTELARLLSCERATAGLQVEECMRRGWVRRKASASDRRSYSLYLTPAGRRMLDGVVGVVARHQKRLGAALSAEECTTLIMIIRKLLASETRT